MHSTLLSPPETARMSPVIDQLPCHTTSLNVLSTCWQRKSRIYYEKKSVVIITYHWIPFPTNTFILCPNDDFTILQQQQRCGKKWSTYCTCNYVHHMADHIHAETHIQCMYLWTAGYSAEGKAHAGTPRHISHPVTVALQLLLQHPVIILFSDNDRRKRNSRREGGEREVYNLHTQYQDNRRSYPYTSQHISTSLTSISSQGYPLPLSPASSQCSLEIVVHPKTKRRKLRILWILLLGNREPAIYKCCSCKLVYTCISTTCTYTCTYIHVPQPGILDWWLGTSSLNCSPASESSGGVEQRWGVGVGWGRGGKKEEGKRREGRKTRWRRGGNSLKHTHNWLCESLTVCAFSVFLYLQAPSPTTMKSKWSQLRLIGKEISKELTVIHNREWLIGWSTGKHQPPLMRSPLDTVHCKWEGRWQKCTCTLYMRNIH